MSTNYSTFQLLRNNRLCLQAIRPDLWYAIEDEKTTLKGSLAEEKDIEDVLSKYLPQVIAINTSIILNEIGFFEGFLENVLLRRIGSVSTLHEPHVHIVKEYQQKIIRVSSIREFKQHFKSLMGVQIKEAIGKEYSNFSFIEHFYIIRHLLAHGSMIMTTFKKQKQGYRLLHTDPDYTNLIKLLRTRYSLKSDTTIEFLSLLMSSEIVDDFCASVESVSNGLVKYLSVNTLIDTSDGWVDFSSWNLYGKITSDEE